MKLRDTLLVSTALNSNSSLEARVEAEAQSRRTDGERQSTARDALRATASTMHGEADFAVRANYYLSLLPGF
jgi:hypothetical protein